MVDAVAYLVAFIIVLAIMISLFYIFRSIVLWYFKLDKIEEHLKNIRSLLEKNGSQK